MLRKGCGMGLVMEKKNVFEKRMGTGGGRRRKGLQGKGEGQGKGERLGNGK